MDGPNTISGAIIQLKNGNSIGSSIASTDAGSGIFSDNSAKMFSDSNNSTGFFSGLTSISLTTWLIIFLILAVLGFNVLVYLAKGTENISNFLQPLLQQIYSLTASITGQTVNVSAEGAKAVVGGTANTINSGLSSVQNVSPNNTPTTIKSQSVQNTIQQPDVMANSTLNKALNTNRAGTQQAQNDDYQANQAASTVNMTGKSGWCYIGEDRGFRSCAQVGVNDECMSGDIFPSQEICVNPNLRA